jgi:hypothetical protein
MKVILTDIDDTILQFSHHFENWARNKKGYNLNSRMREIGSLSDAIGCDRETIDDLILEFSEDHSEFGILTPEKDALYILPILHKMGYQFVAISACIHGPEVTAIRRKNLETAFGFKWLGIHCVGLKQSKEIQLSAHDTAYWVEDNLAHALVGAQVGHKTFLLDRPYNQGELPDGNPMRVKSWHNIFEEIVRNEPKISITDTDLVITNPVPHASVPTMPTGKYKTFNIRS